MIEIIIGFDFFTGACFDGNVPSGSIYRCEISNSIVDMVKIDKGTNTQEYNSQKQSWNLYTQLLCDFKDSTLEAGNITLSGMPIEHIRIKKRKEGKLTWQSYVDIPFVKGQQDYRWNDKFVESLTNYEYAILPVGATVEGNYGIQSVSCEYDDIFILGSNGEQYKLIANINLSDVQTVSESSVITTLGSKYPYEISNGLANYRKSTVKATLVSDSTLEGNNGIDRKAEKILRDKLYEFLTNRNPKVIKESEGIYILVSIPLNSVKLTPYNDLSRRICDISFDFYEINDVNSVQALQECGLL